MLSDKVIVFILLTFGSFNLNAGQIALTFDDVPLSGNALMSGGEVSAAIIETLKNKEIEDALFFVTSKNITSEAKLERLAKYTAAGFHLANHSHAHLSANSVSPTEYLADFYTSHLITKNLDGFLSYHRHPYLHQGSDEAARKKIHHTLIKYGYKMGYVTVDNFEWYINAKAAKEYASGRKINFEKLKRLYVDVLWASIEFYDSIAKKTLGRSPKHILLLHENPLAAMFLRDLIDHIRAQGWEIIKPQDAYTDPISTMYSPEFEFTKQGRIAAIAHSKGAKKENLRHPSENTDYLDGLFLEYGVIEDH